PRLAVIELEWSRIVAQPPPAQSGAGGTVPSLACLAAFRDAAADAGVLIHIDGARVFNAATTLGASASDIVRFSDSVGF
ncbi:MAG TPA: beta-eliminating lyase-related protein, partial [Lacipirellulaceae bacterium]|nr:beta-eliminating lyase-related protein [Lacipirellulaceae bacterium]